MTEEVNVWRETQREPRFFFVDARIFPFVVLAILHVRLWTVIVLIATGILFVGLEARGIRPGRLHRHILTALRGPVIHARHPSHYRQYYNPGAHPREHRTTRVRRQTVRTGDPITVGRSGPPICGHGNSSVRGLPGR